MKNLLYITILFFSLQSFAQKTFEVYNYTSQTVKIADIVTKSPSSTYPEFHSKPFGLISIPPGGSYTLVNTANPYRFPFHSPTSSPYITNWERLNSPSSSTPMGSMAAWTLGSSQVFERMHFYVGNDYTSISTPSGSSASGPGWTAFYDEFIDPVNPNIILYTIVIFLNAFLLDQSINSPLEQL
jgi:hypothetical protein